MVNRAKAMLTKNSANKDHAGELKGKMALRSIRPATENAEGRKSGKAMHPKRVGAARFG